ncbi:hypothetical protein CX029_17450 [Vibrio cholerae]|nr:hypothetical protein [Vibrio cholerae]MBY7676603.1 hypothetical protein [Vibrio mimicus]EJB8348735.1 hypothetical protein [Vibrio cholerae]EJB8377950.1 hypothetical protein [Vibrio cholerae]MBY7728439.1 hypothetical protein [Vibrio mimicus]
MVLDVCLFDSFA